MSSERQTNQPPIFIEVSPGIRVASGINVESHLALREGQNFFEQPPLNWMAAEINIVPVGLFHDDLTEEECMRHLIFMASRQRGLRYSFLDEQREKQLKSATRMFALELKKWMGPVLKADYDLSDPYTLIRIARAIDRIGQYLKQFPYLHEYLWEMFATGGKTANDGYFLPDGTPKRSRLKGSDQIETYAEYARRRGSLDTHWSKWEGLEALLPDVSATLPESGESATAGILWIVAISLNESDNY